MSLPYDTARCAGVQYDGDWREGCEDCLRRTSAGGPMSPSIDAPALVVFECEYRIGPSECESITPLPARTKSARSSYASGPLPQSPAAPIRKRQPHAAEKSGRTNDL